MHSRWSVIATIWLLVLLSGCASSQKRLWSTAQFALPIDSRPIDTSAILDREAEVSYAKAFDLEKANSVECVGWYLRTAELLWPLVADETEGRRGNIEREQFLYRSAVGKFIETAQRFGRWEPTSGIVMEASSTPAAKRTGSESLLPVRMHGFSWEPADFERLTVVGEYRTPDVIHAHRQEGIGVPLLVTHTCQRKFIHPHITFNATAILRPRENTENGEETAGYVLDIVNPLVIRDTEVQGRRQPVAYDLTAAVAYLSVNEDREWLRGFLDPQFVQSGLTMVEPYQSGKVPVVFIHGLASDPMTWAAMANELLVYPELTEYFQFWIFAYPTGKPFPAEAANLRRQLVALRNHIDPQRQDAALDQMVLIGHSMGGLVSKLQVASSGDQLSRSILKVPLEELDLDDENREKFSDFLFFEPSEQISRVVFIGTPHRGSKLANKAGGLASRLVRQSGFADLRNQLLQLNRDAFVTPLRRLPTSVDLLKPENPLLQAIYELPVDSRVRMHSIIGAGHQGRFHGEPSDGVVPVSSAKHPHVESELLVDAGHGLHHHPETIDEVVRILRIHVGIDTTRLQTASVLEH